MNVQNALRIAASAMVLSAAASAQTPSRVLALTNNTPALAQIDDGTCTGTRCPVGLPPVTGVARWAGGTAHDPRDRTTWVSTGTWMRKVNARTGCAPACPAFPVPDLLPGQVLTGLAFNEWTGQLFVSHSDNRILTYDATGGCGLTLNSVCTVTVPPNHVISGLATDDTTNRIFYATGAWLGPLPDPEGFVYTAMQATPCTPICPEFTVSDCSGPNPFVTGLAFDACDASLHATNGRSISTYTMPACAPTYVGCCTPFSANEMLIGLCVLPSTEVRTGNVCFNGTAGPCPGMAHMLGGDPTVGNIAFSLDLVNAPANTWAFININVAGGCLPGVNYGILCTDVPAANFAWFLWTGGGVGCTGSVSNPLPIPPMSALCGLVISSRYWGIDGPPVNNYVSNCLTWMISAS